MAKNKAVQIGGGVVGGGAVLFGLYELYHWAKYKLWKKKNPTSTLTFAQFKAQKLG